MAKPQIQTRRLPDELPLQRRQRPIAAEAINAEKRTVRVCFSAGATVRRHRWVGWDTRVPFDEVLPVSRAAVNLEPFNAGQGVVLDQHHGYSAFAVQAVVERAWLAGGEAWAELRFPAEGISEEADRLFALVADGIVRNVSCGYSIDEVEIKEADQKKGRVEQHIVKRWTPREISFVVIGADPRAQVREAAESVTYPVAFNRAEAQTGDDTMAKPTTRKGQGGATNRQRTRQDDNANRRPEAETVDETRDAVDDDDDPDPDDDGEAEEPRTRAAPSDERRERRPAPRQERQEERTRARPADRREADDEADGQPETPALAERRRIADIRDAVRAFGFEDSVGDPFIDSDADINEVRAALQERLAERSRREAPRTRGQRVENVRDERETRVRLMANALGHRVAPGTVELEEGARQYRGMTLSDMARDCLEAEGVSTRGMTRDEVAGAALNVGQPSGLALRMGYHTTSDFPLILGNEVNRSLRSAYELAEVTYERIARRGNANDFRPIIRAQIGDNPQLLLVGENGEFKRGTIGEGKEQYALKTFGRIVGITRQVIVNDDLDAFSRIPASWGRVARALQNLIVWNLVTTNPVLATSNAALFSAAHGNISTPAGGAIGVDTVGEARRALRRMRGIAGGGKDGEEAQLLANIPARIIAVPAALETAALKFVSPIVVPTGDGAVNPFKGMYDVLVEPILDDVSEEEWYVIGDPNATGIDFIEYAFLEGQDGVYTETRMGFDVDGVEFKARMDFGAGLLDYRGAYKNIGEGNSL